jgi:hypothetical protein
MEASNGMDISSGRVQRIVIIAIVGALLVLAAYLWGNRLSADTVRAVSPAAEYNSLRGVAGARALDAAEARDAAAVASTYRSFNGVAAARAADAAQASAAGASYAAKVLQHEAGGLAAGSASASPSGSQSGRSRGRAEVHAPGAGP